MTGLLGITGFFGFAVYLMFHAAVSNRWESVMHDMNQRPTNQYISPFEATPARRPAAPLLHYLDLKLKHS
jgi:hypothetical protein